MTELEKMLPELNSAQHKLLERYIAEQRIDELELYFKFVPDVMDDRTPIEYKVDRLAHLRKGVDV